MDRFIKSDFYVLIANTFEEKRTAILAFRVAHRDIKILNLLIPASQSACET